MTIREFLGLDGCKETCFKEKFFATGYEMVLLFALPHVSQDLDVTCDLFL
jgi:hypothetical protein